MPLITSARLDSSHHLPVRAAFASLRASSKRPPAFLRAHRSVQLSLALPHEVWDLGLDAIASGAGLGQARFSAVRHLVMGPAGVVAATETPTGSPLAHVTVGPLAQATVDAVRAIETRPEVASDDFEVRLLRVVPLQLLALWLHGPREMLVALPPAPPELKALTLEEADGALLRLQPRAVRRQGTRLHP